MCKFYESELIIVFTAPLTIFCSICLVISCYLIISLFLETFPSSDALPFPGVGTYAHETVSRAEVSAVCFKQENLQRTQGADITDAGNVPVNEVLTIGNNDCSYLPGLLIPYSLFMFRKCKFHKIRISFFFYLMIRYGIIMS